MSITTLSKNYKKLENRLNTLEQTIREYFSGELKEEKVEKLEKISKQLDQGQGKRFTSYRTFRRYVKSL